MVTIKEHYESFTVLGRLDDPKVYLCQHIAAFIENKTKLKTKFIMLFETQFLAHREELIKQDSNFFSLKDSPIIYEKTNENKYNIIGSLENFTKWACAYHSFKEEKMTSLFIEDQMLTLKKNLDKLGNRYAFFNIKIGDSLLNKKIIIELFYNKCPKTCENFLKLCGGFKSKSNEYLSYERTFFHRIVKNSFIQGGDLNQLKIKNQKSIYDGEFPDESFSVEHNTPGIVGMCKKSGRKHSNECQFYITLCEIKTFDQKFVAFGRIIQGFDLVREISYIDTYMHKPLSKSFIVKSGEYHFY